MSEIMTPPTKIVVGEVEYEAFHEGHTFADIVRWIMKNQVDAEELLTILCQATGKEGNAQK